jgi:hypothetical protein
MAELRLHTVHTLHTIPPYKRGGDSVRAALCAFWADFVQIQPSLCAALCATRPPHRVIITRSAGTEHLAPKVNTNEHVEHEQRKAATRTRSVAVAERKARAVELRRSGLTFESIALTLGCSRTRAFELVKSALKTVVQTPTEALRDEALRRLETLWDQTLSIWSAAEPLIQNGAPVMLTVTDSDGQPVTNMKTGQPLVMPAVDKRLMLQVTDRLLRIEESRRRLLGLDQPQRVEVAGDPSAVVSSMDQERLERALAIGLARLRPPPETIDVTSVERRGAE